MEPRQFDSVASAQQWIRDEFGTWADRPTTSHLDALRSYKNADFEWINDALRQRRAGRFDEPTHLAITEAIAAESIGEAIRVFRGIADPDLAELALLHPAEIPHAGFVSVSLVERVATNFTRASVDDRRGSRRSAVLLVGTLPGGTPAAPLDFIPGGENGDEAELLLHSGSALLVEAVDASDLRLIRVYGTWRGP